MTRSEDLLQVGTYDVRVSGKVSYNVGATSTIETKEVLIPLTIIIGNPCLSTTLSDFTVRDMMAEIRIEVDT